MVHSQSAGSQAHAFDDELARCKWEISYAGFKSPGIHGRHQGYRDHRGTRRRQPRTNHNATLGWWRQLKTIAEPRQLLTDVSFRITQREANFAPFRRAAKTMLLFR